MFMFNQETRGARPAQTALPGDLIARIASARKRAGSRQGRNGELDEQLLEELGLRAVSGVGDSRQYVAGASSAFPGFRQA